MKNIIVVITILLVSISTFAQQGINYKAVIKDDLGNVISSQEIDMRLTLEFDAGVEFGIITIYEELHTVTTTNSGIIILNIGEGTVISGAFPQNTWNSGTYMIIEIDLERDGTFVNLGTTDFKTVPMALSARHAIYATTAYTAENVTGLEQITEYNTTTNTSNTGWRLIGKNPNHYGPIGNHAVDLSFTDPNVYTAPYSLGAIGYGSIAMGTNTAASGDSSTAIGNGSNATGDNATAIGSGRALGNGSIAIGNGTEASGDNSTAIGVNTSASGTGSTAIGVSTTAPSYAESVIGRYNSTYIPDNITSWDVDDRLFVIGNGTSFSNKKNALTVLKNGKTGINTSDPKSLFEVTHQDGAPTSANLTNAFSIRNLGGDNNANTSDDESWQLYTEDNGYLLLFRNGSFRGAFNATSGAYGQISDRRLKKDITPLNNGTLNKVMQLNPVSYIMKDQTDTKRNLGLISQEVQELFPSITHYVEEQDILSLSYTELIPILIKALQEQQVIIDGQQTTIESQKAKDVVQDKSIEALVSRLNLIEAKSSN